MIAKAQEIWKSEIYQVVNTNYMKNITRRTVQYSNLGKRVLLGPVYKERGLP